MIECIFGWGKQHGTMRKTKHRGIRGVTADFMLNLIAYNLIRIPKLIAAWRRSSSILRRLKPMAGSSPNDRWSQSGSLQRLHAYGR
jgi:hypothetical protein